MTPFRSLIRKVFVAATLTLVLTSMVTLSTLAVLIGTRPGKAWVMQFVGRELSARLGSPVYFGNFQLGWNKLRLENVAVLGCQGDTLLKVSEITLSWDAFRPMAGTMHLSSLIVKRATVYIHPQPKPNSFTTRDSLVQETNWDCLLKRIPKSSGQGKQSMYLTWNKAIIQQIDWHISGFPNLTYLAPRRTTNLILTHLGTSPSGWHVKYSFRQFIANSPVPLRASGSLASKTHGQVIARRIHVKHQGAELFIPTLASDSTYSLIASNILLRMQEGYLNRWLKAPVSWPSISIHCPSLQWAAGFLRWSQLETDVAGHFNWQSSGHWSPNGTRNTSRPNPQTDTTFAFQWILNAHPHWQQTWQKVHTNLSNGFLPLTKAWNPKSLGQYLPDSSRWTLLGQVCQGSLGLKAEAKGLCGPSELLITAARAHSQAPWEGSAQINQYRMPDGNEIGPTVAQWTFTGSNQWAARLKADSVIVNKELLRNTDLQFTWRNNNLAGQINVSDPLHQLQSEWTGCFRNGKPLSITGHGHLDFRFPPIPEICGPLRALGEFSFRDSAQLTQVDLGNGALLCEQQRLSVSQARLRLNRESPGQVIQMTINEDSIHSLGLSKFEHIPLIIGQITNFLLGDTTSTGQEIPFRAYIKINNLGDYLPFISQAPLLQCSQLKGNLNWSRPQIGFTPYWNRGIRLDIGTAKFKDWAARNITIRTEYLGNNLLVQGQLDSLQKDDQTLFQKVNYQQIRDREFSTLRLTGIDLASRNSALFHGSLQKSQAAWTLGIDTIKANVGNQVWTSLQGGIVRKYGDVWDLDSITLVHDSSRLMLNGLISDKPGNQIKLDIVNLGLTQVLLALGQKSRLVEGIINGRITGDGILNQPNFTGTLQIPRLRKDSLDLGMLSVESSFIPQTNRLLINANLANPSNKPASVTGWLQTNEANVPCDLAITLNGAPLQLLELVLLPNLDSIRGFANAEIRLNGSLNEPKMNGMLSLNNGRLRIPYLKNTYRITGDVRVEPNQFVFLNNEVYDTDRGRARLSGMVKHEDFREWTYQFQIDKASDLLVLNEPRLIKGEYYHGLGRINGSGFIAGDERSTQIQVSAEAVKGSRLVIPLDDLSDESESDFIRFKQTRSGSPPSEQGEKDQTVTLRGLEFTMGLVLNPESEVSLLLDRRYGDQIKGTGNGNLNLTLTREGNFSLTGNYIFEQGNYSFNLVNLVNKNFEIKSGGRIDWNGDPYAGIMQIEAVYKQRASVRNLLGNNLTGITDNRNMLPIETYLNLSGPILQPGVKFRLNLPTINNNNPNDILVQQITRINNNEQELNSQVLGLLVSGQFIPSENLTSANLGISTGATAFNSVTEMLTTRLSNLLNNSLGGGINLGINYRGDLGTGILNSGTGNSSALADSNRKDLNVALNTSLFNNRLIIDGNLAMGNSLQVNSRNMAGEINLEYLINPSGTIRARAFNRPDDRILFNQSQSLNYRQGVGISYNRNFNRWNELLRKNPRP